MKILIFAPHNDDEVLGVGGTICKYVQAGDDVYICEVTSLLTDMELTMRTRNEALKAHKLLGVKETFFLDLPVVGLKDTSTIEVNKRFYDIVCKIRPNIAFIPHKGDMHIDHSEVSKAAMVALRPMENPQLKAIYAYETLSETEWNIPCADNAFIPTVYFDITDFIEKKKQAMLCYQSQIKDFPNPRSIEAIEALSKYRGATIGVDNAESFVAVRIRD